MAILGTRRSLGSRMVWGGLRLLGLGLAYWGVKAWRSRSGNAGYTDGKSLPQKDPAAPRDPVDESSWESFPASDPPAVSPGASPFGSRS